MTAAVDALARTVLLARDYLIPDVTEDEILKTLRETRVTFVADRYALATRNGIDALVTGVVLCARSGAQIALEIDDVSLAGFHAPLVGDRLGSALLELCADLVPETRAIIGCWTRPADLRVIIGASRWRGRAVQVVRASGGIWEGELRAETDASEQFGRELSPFGPLVAGGLVAGEAYKHAMRRLRGFARNAPVFDEQFAPVVRASVALARASTPPPSGRLGAIDFISGGAITQSALYALGRVPDVSGRGRLFEPEWPDPTNINRYALLRRSHLHVPKAVDIAEWFANTALDLAAIQARFDERSFGPTELLAPTTLVGVDHIPSRWLADAVARRRDRFWLGIGATTHYSAMASFHERALPCARCLHPVDDDGPGLIPTVSFVSHWAGLYLASLAARHTSGERLSAALQSTYVSLLRPDLPAAIWRGPVAPRARCAAGCRPRGHRARVH